MTVPSTTTAAAGTTTTAADEPAGDTGVYSSTVNLTVVRPGTVPECLVRTTYTVRMRVDPISSSPVLETIPYDSAMPADLRTIDDGWIRANYIGTLGWVATRYLTESEACEGLNAIAAAE